MLRVKLGEVSIVFNLPKAELLKLAAKLWEKYNLQWIEKES